MPQAAGVNQRGSHICILWGNRSRAGDRALGACWGRGILGTAGRGPNGSRPSRGAQSAELGCPISMPRAPPSSLLFLVSPPAPGCRGAPARVPTGSPRPPPSVSNTPAPGLLRRPGRLAAGARCHGDARAACFELFGEAPP